MLRLLKRGLRPITTRIVQDTATRCIFIGHSVLCMALMQKWSSEFCSATRGKTKNLWEDIDMMCILPLALMLVEYIYSIINKGPKGKIMKYFWIPCFLYICSVMTMVWKSELYLLDTRINKDLVMGKAAKKCKNEIEKLNKICELGLVACIIIGRFLMPRGDLTREQLSALLISYVGNIADIIELFETFNEPNMSEAADVTLAVISIYTWSIFQFSFVTVNFDHNQNRVVPSGIENSNQNESTELQKNARADTQSSLSTPKTPKKKFRNTKRMSTAHSMPIMPALENQQQNQSTPSFNRNIQGVSESNKESYLHDVRAQRQLNTANGPRGHGEATKKRQNLYEKAKKVYIQQDERDEEIQRMKLHGDVFQMMVTLFMQDGPFLALRLYLLIKKDVYSEMHMLFLAKNFLVTSLLVYRLFILICQRDPEEEEEEHDYSREDAAQKLRNVQMAVNATNEFYHMTMNRREKTEPNLFLYNKYKSNGSINGGATGVRELTIPVANRLRRSSTIHGDSNLEQRLNIDREGGNKTTKRDEFSMGVDIGELNTIPQLSETISDMDKLFRASIEAKKLSRVNSMVPV